MLAGVNARGRQHRGLMHVVDWMPTLASFAQASNALPQSDARGGRPLDGQDQRAALESTASPAPPIPLPKRTMLLSFDQALVCGAIRNTAGVKLVINPECVWFWGEETAMPSALAEKSSGWASGTFGALLVKEDAVFNTMWRLYDLSTDVGERVDLMPQAVGGTSQGPVNATLAAMLKELQGAFLDAIRHAVTPLVFVTPGDEAAMPSKHGGRWVSWKSGAKAEK